MLPPEIGRSSYPVRSFSKSIDKQHISYLKLIAVSIDILAVPVKPGGGTPVHGDAKCGQSKGPGRGKVLKNGLCTPPLPLNTEISSRSHNNPVSVGSHPHPLSAIGPAFSCSFQRDSQFLKLPVRSQKPTPHNPSFHLQHNAARMAHHTPYARVKQKSQRPGTVTPQRFRQKQTL